MLPVSSKLLLCSFSVLHLYTSRPLLHIRNVPFDWLYFPIKARCVQWNQNYKVITCSVLSSMVMSQILQILQGSYRFGFAQVIFGNWMCFGIEGEITIQIRCTVLADLYWMFYSFSPPFFQVIISVVKTLRFSMLFGLHIVTFGVSNCSFTADQIEPIYGSSDRCDVMCLCEHWAAKCFVLHKNSG